VAVAVVVRQQLVGTQLILPLPVKVVMEAQELHRLFLACRLLMQVAGVVQEQFKEPLKELVVLVVVEMALNMFRLLLLLQHPGQQILAVVVVELTQHLLLHPVTMAAQAVQASSS
jgi:hypothetical protein